MSASPATSSASVPVPTAGTGGQSLRPLLGILAFCIALGTAPITDGIGKYLSARLPVAEIVWVRYAVHIVLFVPLALWFHGADTFRLKHPATQILRGFFLLGASLFFFQALAVMPMVDAVAVLFVYPFIVTALSPMVLREPVGLWRWLAVAAGFAGAMIVIRPDSGVVSAGTIFALAAGACFAFHVLATRRVSGADPPLATLTISGLVGLAGASLIAVPQWIAPTPLEWAWLLALGAIASMASVLTIVAYRHATAPTLAPFAYVEIPGATLIGWAVFGDLPDALTWLGIAVIAASGIVIAVREGRRPRAGKAADAAPLPGGPNVP